MKTIAEYAEMVNIEIRRLKEANPQPESLFAPIFYALDGGGKRLRPVLVLAVADALGAHLPTFLHVAFAMEVFHNFTLLHDDIMDHADTRHGRPSVFRRFGEDSAILSGDAMLTLAAMLLVDNRDIPLEMKSKLHNSFNVTAMNVYRGQAFDMEFEHRNDVTIEEYERMIGFKTAALIGGSCHIGALCADASSHTSISFFEYGDNLGMAFQLQDDLLDTYGDPARFGKPIGGDILNDKKTWLNITAWNRAPEAMAAASKLEGEEKINAVRRVYDSLNLSEECAAIIDRYTRRAIESISHIGISDEALKFFTDFANNLLGRTK